MKTKPYYWQSGDTLWWLVAKFFGASGFTDPYQFLAALRLVNPTVYQTRGAWASVTVGTLINIPSRV